MGHWRNSGDTKPGCASCFEMSDHVTGFTIQREYGVKVVSCSRRKSSLPCIYCKRKMKGLVVTEAQLISCLSPRLPTDAVLCSLCPWLKLLPCPLEPLRDHLWQSGLVSCWLRWVFHGGALGCREPHRRFCLHHTVLKQDPKMTGGPGLLNWYMWLPRYIQCNESSLFPLPSSLLLQQSRMVQRLGKLLVKSGSLRIPVTAPKFFRLNFEESVPWNFLGTEDSASTISYCLSHATSCLSGWPEPTVPQSLQSLPFSVLISLLF